MKLVLNSKNLTERSSRAFTLVEIVLVIGIIGILATLVLTTLPNALKRANINKVKAEFSRLDLAIKEYYATYNSYPPDNPTNNLISPLYYELLGASWNDSLKGYDLVGERMLETNYHKYFAQDGMLNVTHNPNDASAPKSKPFLTGLSPSSYISITNADSIDLKVFRLPVEDFETNMVVSANGKLVNVWHYRSGNNASYNKGKYDLWGEFSVGGTRYRVSSWEGEPVRIEDVKR